MRLRTRTFLVSLVLTTVVIGCRDQAESPTSPMTATDATPLSWQSGEGCAPYMIICDDEGFTWFDDGFEEVYTDFSDGDLFELSVSESNLAWSGCPSYVVGVYFGNVYVTNPSGNKQSVPFMTTGTWSWKADLGPMRARYNWPPGYWPAIDGSGIQIQISAADGTCRVAPGGLTYVSFTRYHHVNARFPRRRGYTLTGGGGGGGDGGGSGQCRQEWVIVEVNYGDGSGWHVIWEGYATVCS